MNPTATLISIGIGFMTMLLAIFGASWLNQGAIERYIDAKFEAVDARFKAMEAKFEAVDARFAAMDARFIAVDARLDRIERQLEAIFKPVLPR